MATDHTPIPAGERRDVLDTTGAYAFRITRDPSRAWEWQVVLTDGPGAAGDEFTISAGDLEHATEGLRRLADAAARTLEVLEAQKEETGP
jgi:hypothetical protein